MQLRDFDPEQFLAEYWQKKPLLIRAGFEPWTNPLDPDELAGLAREADIESRLIVRTRKTWKVAHGPFKPRRFSKLGKKPWTLLVQAVDHYVPAVAALLDAVGFIPNWRTDDVMVSYANDGGGVGPHFDQYDVFLVQGMGQRRWRLGQKCGATTALLQHDDLRLLTDFIATEEWLLNPGDILYIPPGIAHDGVAVGDDCMTYSIGFRAPSRSELIAHWCDHLLGELSEDDRYADPGLRLQRERGEIAPEAIDALHAIVTEKLNDRTAFARWFGQYITAPKDRDVEADAATTAESLCAGLADGTALVRTPGSRFSFVHDEDGSGLFFADGVCFPCIAESFAVAQRICAARGQSIDLPLPQLEAAAIALIGSLVRQGSVQVTRNRNSG